MTALEKSVPSLANADWISLKRSFFFPLSATPDSRAPRIIFSMMRFSTGKRQATRVEWA